MSRHRHLNDEGGATIEVATPHGADDPSMSRPVDESTHGLVDADPRLEPVAEPTAGPADVPSSTEVPADVVPSAPAPEPVDASDVLRPGGGMPLRRPAQVIALMNQKGGVGKTTTTISLGAALAELGQRVLLVDMDPQGSLGVGLGTEPHGLDTTIYNLLMHDGTNPDEVIVETAQERLHLLPANIDLAAAELLLVQEVAREQSLRRILDRLRYRYDYILIDCPPSLGLLTINALTASDSVIVPLECEYFALRGMRLLMDTLRKVQERLNPQLEVKGIIPTMFDPRTVHAREVLERVREAFGDLVFTTTINKTVRFAEAPVVGAPITTYAPKSKGADAYRDLAKEVLSREPAS